MRLFCNSRSQKMSKGSKYGIGTLGCASGVTILFPPQLDFISDLLWDKRTTHGNRLQEQKLDFVLLNEMVCISY